MIKQSKGKIFLADERGLNETDWFRTRNTFNFGKYYNEHKQPVGNIYVLNDDTLDGGRSLSMLIEEYSYLVLLPVIGAVVYNDSLGNENLIAAGQALMLNPDRGTTIQIKNPFKKELINFLQIWIKACKEPQPTQCFLSTYDVNESINSLTGILHQNTGTSGLPFFLSVGKFSGRGETTYQPQKNDSQIFVFVIEGAFEVAGRLLHAKDGLALWETKEVEMEALSNDAIILLIESPLN